MNTMIRKLCSIQGRLFELSAKHGLESNGFVVAYMNSDVAAKFNSVYDRSQWMGEEYILDELKQTYQLKDGKTYSPDVLFWMGYTYAYWSIVYGDTCKNIIKMADSKVMAANYAGLHTVSIDMAIQDLKEQYWSRGNNGARLIEEVYKKIIKDALNSRANTTDYQRFLNELGTDILFYLKNEASQRAYNNQLRNYQQYITKRIYFTYIDYILDLIEKANISPKEKSEYMYVVRDIKSSAMKRGFTNVHFVVLDSLESRLRNSMAT